MSRRASTSTSTRKRRTPLRFEDMEYDVDNIQTASEGEDDESIDCANLDGITLPQEALFDLNHQSDEDDESEIDEPPKKQRKTSKSTSTKVKLNARQDSEWTAPSRVKHVVEEKAPTNGFQFHNFICKDYANAEKVHKMSMLHWFFEFRTVEHHMEEVSPFGLNYHLLMPFS